MPQGLCGAFAIYLLLVNDEWVLGAGCLEGLRCLGCVAVQLGGGRQSAPSRHWPPVRNRLL